MSAGAPIKNNQGYTSHNRVQLVHGGKEYFACLLKLLIEAKTTIQLQTYIFDDDDTGKAVANALKAAASRGVRVYLLVDGYASQVMSRHFIHELKAAGVHFRFFEPVFRSKQFYFGRRLHHKVVVVDNQSAIVGGINITNRYNDMAGHPGWLDFALFVEGDIAKELCILCWKTWRGFPAKLNQAPCNENTGELHILSNESMLVRMRRNDWVRRKNQISRTYVELFRTANGQISILCSYFLPGRIIMRNLLRAAKRGVKIKLILGGLSDVMIAKHAERHIYGKLLKNGIEIFEYQGNILHGKVAVCDDTWMTLGSYNVNNISAYASIELNLDVYNAVFTKSVRENLDAIIRDSCIRITEENYYRTSNIFKRFIRWSCYQLIRLIFYLFTFYFRQKS
ncbi:MAG TPA: phospholipase D-like domain-containing protein [Chitinophagaceae bacterium]|jgi:cardiolipin synthase|nr:phospholipase D-like domain-containing protein [Chitinophagaceae bacterium]